MTKRYTNPIVLVFLVLAAFSVGCSKSKHSRDRNTNRNGLNGRNVDYNQLTPQQRQCVDERRSRGLDETVCYPANLGLQQNDLLRQQQMQGNGQILDFGKNKGATTVTTKTVCNEECHVTCHKVERDECGRIKKQKKRSKCDEDEVDTKVAKIVILQQGPGQGPEQGPYYPPGASLPVVKLPNGKYTSVHPDGGGYQGPGQGPEQGPGQYPGFEPPPPVDVAPLPPVNPVIPPAPPKGVVEKKKDVEGPPVVVPPPPVDTKVATGGATQEPKGGNILDTNGATQLPPDLKGSRDTTQGPGQLPGKGSVQEPDIIVNNTSAAVRTAGQALQVQWISYFEMPNPGHGNEAQIDIAKKAQYAHHRSNLHEVKTPTNGVDYNTKTKFMSNVHDPKLTTELVDYLNGTVSSSGINICDQDINASGPCFVVEKDSLNPGGGARFSVYLVSAKIKGAEISYYRSEAGDFNQQYSLVETAKRDFKNEADGFYIFSKAQVELPGGVEATGANGGAITYPEDGGPDTDNLEVSDATVQRPLGGAAAGGNSQQDPPLPLPNVGRPPPAHQGPTQGVVTQGPTVEQEYSQYWQQGISVQQAGYADMQQDYQSCLKRLEQRNNRCREGYTVPGCNLQTHPLPACEAPIDPSTLYSADRRDQIYAQNGNKGEVYACLVKINYIDKNLLIGVASGQQNEGQGTIYCKPLIHVGPVLKVKIRAREDLGLAFGVNLGESDNVLLATGLGWANGPDDIALLGKYPYLIQAQAAAPLVGGAGVVGPIVGYDRQQGIGPILAIGLTWVKWGTANVKARVNVFGSWTLGIDG